jgi:Uma2 family endonuclease
LAQNPPQSTLDTPEGVRVPDVAAMPVERARPHIEAASLPESPDICVEVLSESTIPEEIEEKRQLLAACGCGEFWTCSEEGK